MNTTVAALLFLLPVIAAAGEQVHGTPVTKTVSVEGVSSLPVSELWSFLAPKKAETDAVIVDYRAYDPESRLDRGRAHACGVLMVGTGDLGIRPLALRIWSSGSCQIEVSAIPPAKDPSSAFEVKLDGRREFVLRVSDELEVYADAKRLGHIEVP